MSGWWKKLVEKVGGFNGLMDTFVEESAVIRSLSVTLITS